jgi:hypothetical protein
MGDQRPATEKLSPAKRKALIACLAGDGTLRRCHGAWASSVADPIQGTTVADLIRDGLLERSTSEIRRPVQLTPLGKWYADSAASELDYPS